MLSLLFSNRILIFGVIIAMLSGAFYFYYHYSQNKIQKLIEINATLENNIKVLKNSIEEQKKTIDLMKKNYDMQKKANDELNRKLTKIAEEKNRLERILNKHNLTELSTKKPGLIERRINDGTRKVLKELENITK